MANSYDNWDINSAGVRANIGQPPHEVVTNYIHEIKKLPRYSHQSQQVTKKLLKKYYWILVMENAHKKPINKLSIPLESRMFTVREFGVNNPLENIDMPDPTSKEFGDYDELFSIMDYDIPRIAKFLADKVGELEASSFL